MPAIRMSPTLSASERFFGDLPSLALFPQKWVFVKGEMYEKHSGKHITKAERAATLARAQAGDMRAIDDVVRSNIGLALKAYGRVWEKQGGSDLQPDDLFQEALIGLARAAQMHDTERSGFATYAFIRMEQNMRRFIEEKRRVVHLPSHTSAIRARYHKLKQPLEQKGTLDRRELAAALHDKEMLNVPTISALEKFERTYYINTTFSPFEESFSNVSAHDVTIQGLPLSAEPSHDIAERAQREHQIHEALSKIVGTEEFVLRMRFGITAKETVDLRRLVSRAFNFFIDDEVVEGETTEDLLRRARSVTEDRLGRHQSTGRPIRFVELLERAYAVREKPLSRKELESYTETERLFFAAYGCIDERQMQHLPIVTDATLDEVSELYGTSRERTRQIEAQGLRHLKHPAHSKKLRQVLPE